MVWRRWTGRLRSVRSENAVTNVTTNVGDLLRQWRSLRGVSQVALALDAGVSQRHVSFIESGRSIPSRSTLLVLATALSVPLRERNQLLLASGFAPIYSEQPWDAPELEAIGRALRRHLRQHEPFPALVMDRSWNVLLRNEAAPRLFKHFFDLDAYPQPRNLLELLTDANGLRPFVANWDELGPALRERVLAEAVGGIVDDSARRWLRALPEREPKGGAPPSPIVPISLRLGDAILNYFSLITTVGTPQAVAAQELRIESMFPMDDATESLHLELMGEPEVQPSKTQ